MASSRLSPRAPFTTYSYTTMSETLSRVWTSQMYVFSSVPYFSSLLSGLMLDKLALGQKEAGRGSIYQELRDAAVRGRKGTRACFGIHEASVHWRTRSRCLHMATLLCT
jgi:hypothetical protein